MATGMQRLVRRSLLSKLKADVSLTILVAPTSINPPDVPTWPYIVLRSPVTRPFKVATKGAQGSWDIHAFAGQRMYGNQVFDTAEDHASAIGAAIEDALADTWLDLIDLPGERVRIGLSDIRLLQDGDPDHYHWFCQCNWRSVAC